MHKKDMTIKAKNINKNTFKKIVPYLLAYMNEILPVYQQADELKKRELREHNELLDIILTLGGQ